MYNITEYDRVFFLIIKQHKLKIEISQCNNDRNI